MSFDFDPAAIPYSVPGSILTIGSVVQNRHRYTAPGKTPDDEPGIFLRTISYFAKLKEILEFVPLRNGEPVGCTWSADPSGVTCRVGETGEAHLLLTEGGDVSIRLSGIGLRLKRDSKKPFDHCTVKSGHEVVLNSSECDGNWLIRQTRGTMHVDAPWERVRSESFAIDLLPDDAGVGHADIRSWNHCEFYPEPLPDHDALRAEATPAWEAWLAPFLQAKSSWGGAVRKAAYLLWSNQVGPRGILTRRVTYQSQYKMTHFWCWDHCFVAVGLAPLHPDRAWEEILGAFDKQAPNGALPASFNDGHIHFGHAKPPVHGWALQKMEEAGALTRERKAAILEPMARWTSWWFEHLDWTGMGLPVYTHGNDSGWDNASCYDVPPPFITPELPTYLSIQLEWQARTAEELGDSRAEGWHAQAARLREALLGHLWDGTRFVAKRALDGTTCPGDSLLCCMPILLGDHLPGDAREWCLSRLGDSGAFLSPYGLATEAAGSPYRCHDGYWRGPIWAPAVALLVDGVRRSGDGALARRIAARFCGVCDAGGFSENFDPDTGEARRDPTYTWTAGSMLMLLRDFPDLTPADA